MLPSAQSTRVGLCSLLFFLSAFGCVAQDTGPFKIPKGWENDADLLLTGEDPSRRGDFCARQREVALGNVPLRDALVGANISIMVNLMEWGPWHGSFGVCDDTRDVGCVFHGAVMDELSRRAGFNYKDSFTIGDSVKAKNYKAWMMWVAKNYDVGIGIATETADRLADGLVWNAYLTDNSFVLATRKVLEEKPVFETLFQFLTPFSWSVWGFLVLGGILSSILYVITERHANPEDLPPGPLWAQLGDAIMLASFQFTGAGGFTPKTAAGRGITFTWGFTTFLTIAAYTANLASFLISKEQTGFTITTIDEANQAGARLCHRRGWAIERFLAESYPRIVRVPTDSQAEAWEFMRDHKCVAEAMFLSGFRSEEVKNSYNPECQLALTPALPFSAQSGGWYSQSDNGYLCTGLVKDVFQLHASEMVVDGRIEKYFKDFVEVGAASDPRPKPCPKEEDVVVSQQMGMENMGGIYIVHAVLTGLAALTILEVCIWKKAQHHSKHGRHGHKHRHLNQRLAHANSARSFGTDITSDSPPMASDLAVQLVYDPANPDGSCAPRSGKERLRGAGGGGGECEGGCRCWELSGRVEELASGGEALSARLEELSAEQAGRFQALQRSLDAQLHMLAALTGHTLPVTEGGDLPVKGAGSVNLKPGPGQSRSRSGEARGVPVTLVPLARKDEIPRVNSESLLGGHDAENSEHGGARRRVQVGEQLQRAGGSRPGGPGVTVVPVAVQDLPVGDADALLEAQLTAGRSANQTASSDSGSGPSHGPQHAPFAAPNSGGRAVTAPVNHSAVLCSPRHFAEAEVTVAAVAPAWRPALWEEGPG